MRITRSASGRCARVLAAAALVTVTAACGPADFAATATSASATNAAEGAGQVLADSPAPAPVEPADGKPADQRPADGKPVDPEAVDAEPAPAAAPPVDESSEGTSTGTTDPSAEVGSESEASAGEDAEAPAHRAGSRRPANPSVAAAAAPASPATSSGAGGSFTDQQRTTFTAANGRTGRYLRYAGGIDPSSPVGLVVYADGTGEFGVDNPTSTYALGGPSGLVAAARGHNMITLAVESPDQSCECWHTGDTSGNADFLANLIETHLRSYPISEVWLVGFSSGAQEITRFLVPRHPELMRLGGGWVVFGGGGPAADGGSGVTAQRMAGVRGHWFTGTADTTVPLTASWGAAAGERWYGARGVRTSHEWASGVGHGLDGRLGRTVARLLDES